MHNLTCESYLFHDHSFGQGGRRPQERRAIAVTLLTLLVMAVEIVAGRLTGSMALLADGIHMGTHALALGLAAAAYIFARRHAADRRFSFGSGKAGDLAGFTSALLLGGSVVLLVIESMHRLLTPQPISYREALIVAGIGLVVNIVSALALTGGHSHHHDHVDDRQTTDAHHHHDHNLRAAIMHVLADALTSVAAIIALLAAWWLGWQWLDPLVALVASGIIALWAYGLLRDTGRVLLDMEAPGEARQQIVTALESDGDSRVTDLHIWSVGPGVYTLVAVVVTHQERHPDQYKTLLPSDLGIHHPIIEVRHCRTCE